MGFVGLHLIKRVRKYSLLNFGKYLSELEASDRVEWVSAKPRTIDHKNRTELPKELKGSPAP